MLGSVKIDVREKCDEKKIDVLFKMFREFFFHVVHIKIENVYQVLKQARHTSCNIKIDLVS